VGSLAHAGTLHLASCVSLAIACRDSPVIDFACMFACMFACIRMCVARPVRASVAVVTVKLGGALWHVRCVLDVGFDDGRF